MTTGRDGDEDAIAGRGEDFVMALIEFICCQRREDREEETGSPRSLLRSYLIPIQTHATNTIPKFFCRSGNRVSRRWSRSSAPKVPNDTSRPHIETHSSHSMLDQIRGPQAHDIIGHYYHITLDCKAVNSSHCSLIPALTLAHTSGPCTAFLISLAFPHIMKVKSRA